MGGRHISPRTTIVVSIALFVLVTLVRFLAGDDLTNPYAVLYVLPIGLLGAAFELSGGFTASLLAVGLLAAWSLIAGVNIDPAGWLVRGTTFVAVGIGFGMLSKLRVREELRTTRWFAMSNDMLAEASFEGYFTKVNEGWTETLGYSENRPSA